MFTKLIDTLKATRRTIVFTEGPDARILEATDRLLKDDLMDVILIGNVDEVKAAAEKGNFCICKATIIDPATYAGMDEMVAKMVELRKGKMSEEDCRAALAKGNYFGTMLVKMGKADALLGGATYSTADTVRPALQLVKTKKGAHLVSSSFILFRKDKDGNDEKYCMGDCAINIDYPDTVDKPMQLQTISRVSGTCGSCIFENPLFHTPSIRSTDDQSVPSRSKIIAFLSSSFVWIRFGRNIRNTIFIITLSVPF